MIAGLIAALWLSMADRLGIADQGSALGAVYLDSVAYSDGSDAGEWVARWIALDELEAVLGWPDDAAFSAARGMMMWE